MLVVLLFGKLGIRSSLRCVPVEELDFLEDMVFSVFERLTFGDERLCGEIGRIDSAEGC